MVLMPRDSNLALMERILKRIFCFFSLSPLSLNTMSALGCSRLIIYNLKIFFCRIFRTVNFRRSRNLYFITCLLVVVIVVLIVVFVDVVVDVAISANEDRFSFIIIILYYHNKLII